MGGGTFELGPVGPRAWPPQQAAGGGASDLDGLTDVSLGVLNPGDVFTYNGTAWTNEPPSVFANNIDLDDLSNVDVSGAFFEDILYFDGVNWTYTNIGSLLFNAFLDDLGDVNVGTPGAGQDGYVLQWDNALGEFNLVPQSGGGVVNLDDLMDVNTGSPGPAEDGFSLTWDNSLGEYVLTNVAGGGGTLTGSGVTGQVALWSGATSLTGDIELTYNTVTNRLSIGGPDVGNGSISIPVTGASGGVFWPGAFANPAGFYFDNTTGTTGDGSYHLHTRFGTSLILGDGSLAADRELRLQSLGTGLGNLGIEGKLSLYNVNDFVGGIGDATDSIINMQDDNYLLWTNGVNPRFFGFRSNGFGGEYLFGRGTVADINLANKEEFNNGTRVQFYIGSNRDETQAPGDLNVEGVIKAYDTLGYTGAQLPNTGLIRLARPAAPTGSFAGIYGIGDNTFVTNEVPLIGVRRGSPNTWINNTDAWPTAPAVGFLSNDGSGNLSWSASVGGSIALTDISDVTAPTPSADDILSYNGTAWVNTTPTTIASTINIEDINNSVITAPASGDLYTYNGTNWVNTTPNNWAMNFLVLNDLGDVNAPSPTSGDVLQWNGSNWVPTPSGSGVTGAGVAGQVAVWSGATNLIGDAELLYDSGANRLRIGTSSANEGALGLPAGAAGGIFFLGTGANLGFFTDNIAGDDVYVFPADEGGSNRVDFVVNQAGGSDRPFRMSTRGAGQANLEVEGGLRLFNGTFAADVPAVSGSCSIGLRAGVEGAIRWSATAGSGPDLGVWLDTVNSRDAYVWEKNSNNGLDFMIDETGGASRTWRFGTSGLGLCDVAIEGHLEIWDQANFPSNGVATAGTLRFGQDPFIYGRDDLNTNRVIIAYDSTANRVTIGGAQNSFYPSTNSAGVLTNDGAGDLTWEPASSLPGSFDIGDIGNVNDSGVVNGQGLVFTGTEYENKHVVSTSQRTRTLYGRIDTGGGIISGSSPGFTITKLGAGQYRINYNSNFDSNSKCVATAQTTAGIIQPKVMSTSPAVNSCTVFSRRLDTGVTEDSFWSFMAIGLGVA